MLYGIKTILPVYIGPLLIENDNAFLITELNTSASTKSFIAGDIKNTLALFPEIICLKISKRGG